MATHDPSRGVLDPEFLRSGIGYEPILSNTHEYMNLETSFEMASSTLKVGFILLQRISI